jgi:glutathione peroxidase
MPRRAVFWESDLPMSLYDINVTTIKGKTESLDVYRGQAMLIVNVASRCGFTPQYKGLEALYQQYRDRGFVILGFPCDQFGNQEPGPETEIAQFCELNFGVSFPLFAKVLVNGPEAHPLFQYLTKAKRGFLGTRAIKWNFTKFLVDRQGNVTRRFGSMTKPESLHRHVEALLG